MLRRCGLLRPHRGDGGPAGERLHQGPQTDPGDAVSTGKLGVVEENGVRRDGPEEGVERLVALGRALSDPVRVRMLGMMAEGRGCCSLPDCGVPAEDQDVGICICEFEGYFEMGQSKVSYHMKKLKEAGLVREEKRGKWSFYS